MGTGIHSPFFGRWSYWRAASFVAETGPHRLEHLGQDRRGGVVVEIDHRGHFSPGSQQSKVQCPKSGSGVGRKPEPSSAARSPRVLPKAVCGCRNPERCACSGASEGGSDSQLQISAPIPWPRVLETAGIHSCEILTVITVLADSS